MSEPPQPIPLTILTGPRGAGKTTLLNLALAAPAMAGTLAIQNEAGRTALDAARAIVAEHGEEAFSGCLCCGPRDELSRLFEDMLRRRDNHRIAPFARAVFETAGVGDPAAIIAAIRAHPYLSRRYAIAGIVAVFDPACAQGLLANDPAAIAQADAADAVVLSRSDQGGASADLEQVKACIAGINGHARILDWPASADAPALFAPSLHDVSRRTEGARRAVYRHAIGGAGARTAGRAP